MKLLFICTDIPYPPIHGGRVDTWRRIKAFHSLGTTLSLVTWYTDRTREIPEPEHLTEIRRYAINVIALPIRRDLRSLLRRAVLFGKYPSHVASRVLSEKSEGQVWEMAQKFKPDAIWLDGIYGGVLASQLSSRLGLPLFTRSHNIEHRYMACQSALAKNPRDRLAWWLATRHLETFEESMLRNSQLFFDISVDDMAFWQRRGLSNGRWLPPIIEASGIPIEPTPPSFDVVFLGNLSTPNNVEGVHWFLSKVLPLVILEMPKVSVAIAGSRPVKSIIDACENMPNVVLMKDPPNAEAIFRSGRVLINPVLHGSGVNVKSVEMLFTNAPIVSTPQGVGGLPDNVKSEFSVAMSPEEYAAQIVRSLKETRGLENENCSLRHQLRELFSVSKIRFVLDEIALASKRVSGIL